MAKVYGVDVAGYQPNSLAAYYRAGAKFAIVKATEGTNFLSPSAVSQIRSAHRYRMRVHAYHFAHFGNSKRQAKKEAKFFIKRCKVLNISKKRYLVLDWEASPYNYVNGSWSANTHAILVFMHQIKKAGYKPMLYSGASLLRNNIQTSRIVNHYGQCIWVASYATMGRIDQPDFGYFPSMKGVAIWQFTDNWKGLNVDGNVSLLKHKAAKSAAKKVDKQPSIVYAPVIAGNPHYMISLRDSNGHATGKFIPTNSRWKVFDQKYIKGRKFYKLGTDKQWVPAKYLKAE